MIMQMAQGVKRRAERARGEPLDRQAEPAPGRRAPRISDANDRQMHGFRKSAGTVRFVETQERPGNANASADLGD